MPKVQAVEVGDSIDIRCFTRDDPTWKYGYYNDDVDIDNACSISVGHIYVSRYHHIFIKKSRHNHGGIYCCMGTSINGTQFEAIAYVFVGSKIALCTHTLWNYQQPAPPSSTL